MWLRITALAVLTVAAAVAQALYGNGISARSVAAGGTFAETDLFSAMSVNPAGLASSPRRVDLGLLGMFAHGSFANSVDPNGSLRPALGALPYGAVALPVKRITIGAAFLPETLLSAQWNYTDPPGTAGATYGNFDHKSQILAGRASVGFGMDISRHVSVGATAGFVYNQNTLRTPYIFQLHPVLRGLKTALDLNTSGHGWNGTFGILVRPVKTVSLHAAYKTRTALPTFGSAAGTLDRQFEAIGLAAQPNWRYDARVDNTLPQSVASGFTWRTHPRVLLHGQVDWVNWSRAFRTLPVTLTNGTNPDVNGLLGSNSIRDGVPLNWRDQFVWRLGTETPITESVTLRFGGFSTQNPVPAATLTPLTGAIMRRAATTGVGYSRGRWRTDLAYALSLPSEARVGQSGLAAGEYSNSRVRITLHSLILGGSLRF